MVVRIVALVAGGGMMLLAQGCLWSSPSIDSVYERPDQPASLDGKIGAFGVTGRSLDGGTGDGGAASGARPSPHASDGGASSGHGTADSGARVADASVVAPDDRGPGVDCCFNGRYLRCEAANACPEAVFADCVADCGGANDPVCAALCTEDAKAAIFDACDPTVPPPPTSRCGG